MCVRIGATQRKHFQFGGWPVEFVNVMIVDTGLLSVKLSQKPAFPMESAKPVSEVSRTVKAYMALRECGTKNLIEATNPNADISISRAMQFLASSSVMASGKAKARLAMKTGPSLRNFTAPTASGSGSGR